MRKHTKCGIPRWKIRQINPGVANVSKSLKLATSGKDRTTPNPIMPIDNQVIHSVTKERTTPAPASTTAKTREGVSVDSCQPSNYTNTKKQKPTTANEPLLKGSGGSEKSQSGWRSWRVKCTHLPWRKSHKAFERFLIQMLLKWTAWPVEEGKACPL